MKTSLIACILGFFLLYGCDQPEQEASLQDTTHVEDFQWQTEQFADLRILRYQIPDFDQLSLQQKKLVYYLVRAGLSGRDIMYDQNYRHNLEIRKALENMVRNYQGNKNTEEWNQFMTYTKRVWFSNGIHHHYSNLKFTPEFSQDYFSQLLSETGTELSDEAITALFDPEVDPKKVNKAADVDLLQTSAVNFYGPDVTQEEVEAFYEQMIDPGNPRPISHGLNSRVVRDEAGSLHEEVWKVGGLYGPAIEQIIFWLEKAVGVAENEAQAEALRLLIEYYKTGDLEIWDQYNIAWVQATEGDIDYINGFIEVYNDPLGIKGSYENIVEIRDFEASDRMQTLSENAQWFEDNSSIMDEHKKQNVVGVTYKVVNVAGESGDASPATPIGVNLPNANWIRAEYGSKSVSLGNIEHAYDQATGEGFLEEFAYDEEQIERAKNYGTLAGKLHTALHEVVGHASGKINAGIGTPKETLKNYASTLEEARADLVALFYLMDPKIIELGLMDTLAVGMAEYDSYIRNGLMLQLRRINPGEDIEQDHMRNRQMIAAWAYELGQADSVIQKVVENDKTYFVVRDYDQLRDIFGQQLREIQRIKSEGDFEAGKELVEKYGVKVDSELHAEVLERAKQLDIAPYAGFINPELVLVMEGDSIKDIEVQYPTDFTEQMLYYGETYSFLPGVDEI